MVAGVDADMIPVPETPPVTPDRPRDRAPGTPVEPDEIIDMEGTVELESGGVRRTDRISVVDL